MILALNKETQVMELYLNNASISSIEGRNFDWVLVVTDECQPNVQVEQSLLEAFRLSTSVNVRNGQDIALIHHGRIDYV